MFGYAGSIKIQSVADFSHVVARFDILPLGMINPVAITLPIFELILAIGIFIPFVQRPSLLGVLCCCALFAIILASAIVRGIAVSCGCFGMNETPSIHAVWWALGRDALLFLAAALLYVRRLDQTARR
jgi:hypothetical protein